MGAVIKIIEFKKLANWKVGLPNCSFFNKKYSFDWFLVLVTVMVMVAFLSLLDYL